MKRFGKTRTDDDGTPAVLVQVDCYEQEIITRALRYYKAILTVEYENELACAQVAAAHTEEDAMANPDLSSAQEWLIRTTTLCKEAEKVLA